MMRTFCLPSQSHLGTHLFQLKIKVNKLLFKSRLVRLLEKVLNSFTEKNPCRKYLKGYSNINL